MNKSINKRFEAFSILNEEKYFSSGIFQNQLKNTINILLALLRLNRRNLMEYQKKVLKM